MRRKMRLWRGISALAIVAVFGSIAPALAQTNGMNRRNERRDNRAAARAAKQACKAGDEKTRAECRQMKRDVKQAGRNDVGSNANSAPSPKPAQ